MAERKFFRTTFRGFSKKDVLAHIDTLHTQQQEKLKDMQQQVELAQQQSAAARAEADAVIALPAAQLAELEQLRQAVVSYEQETQALKKELEESNRALSALWEQQKYLQEHIARADEFIADAQAISAQLAARVQAYGVHPSVMPVASAPAAPQTAQETPAEKIDVKDSTAPKNGMADWLF